MSELIPCGGCGAESPKDRCIGCMHDFGEQASATDAQRVAKLELENMRLKEICESNRVRFCQHMTERLTVDNSRLRALLQKAHDEFAKTDHWYHSDIKDELAKELGL